LIARIDHLAARGNAQRVLLDSADGETQKRLELSG
jgi:hypothetical protein